MSKLCISLPPFAPDYSGAASALFEMGGLVVIHDASGCTGNYTGFDEPRWFGSNSLVFCSGLRHMDSILGNDDKFVRMIVEAAEEFQPKFIAILGSPVPMVIGTDFKGIAMEIEAETGIPTMGIATNGLNYYGAGIGSATIELLKMFVKEKKPTVSNSINIVGMTPLDFHVNYNKEDFVELFENAGISVRSCYSMGSNLESIQNSTESALNVVVSQAGIGIAEYLKKKFDIPYVAITPLGDGELALNRVKAAFSDQENTYVPRVENADTLIVGEQIIGNSLREYLQEKCHYGAIEVATLFDVSEQWQSRGDIAVKDETHLRQILNGGKYRTVIGDPMIKQLIRDKKVNFYEFSHVALSGKLHWNENKRLLSNETQEWLEKIN